MQLGGLTYIPTKGDLKGGTDFLIGAGIEAMFGGNVFLYLNGGSAVYNPKRLDFDRKDALLLNSALGVGYRVFDLREEGRGQLLTANIAFSTRFSSLSKNSIYTNHDFSSYSYGGELFVNYYYNIFKHFALRVGANFGVFGTLASEHIGMYLPLNYYSIKSDSKGISLTYGLSVGLAF